MRLDIFDKTKVQPSQIWLCLADVLMVGMYFVGYNR